MTLRQESGPQPRETTLALRGALMMKAVGEHHHMSAVQAEAEAEA